LVEKRDYHDYNPYSPISFPPSVDGLATIRQMLMA